MEGNAVSSKVHLYWPVSSTTSLTTTKQIVLYLLQYVTNARPETSRSVFPEGCLTKGLRQVITYRRPAYFVSISPRNEAQFERLLTARTCGNGAENPNYECVLCHGTLLSPRQRENMLSKNSNSDCPPSPQRFEEIQGNKRTLKPGDKRFKANRTPKVSLTKTDILMGRLETRSSARGMCRFAIGRRKEDSS